MEKYICDKCGTIYIEKFEHCLICHGQLISEEQMQEKEEIARLTDEEKGDDNMTPREDSIDEVVDLIIVEAMQKNMKELGNAKLYKSIEGITEAKQRVRYRKYFLMVGGYIPITEEIIK
jgi:RNA polymerase subunit RPABC4/transcription elongation factor Spt4